MMQLLPTEVMIILHNNIRKCSCSIYSYKDKNLDIFSNIDRGRSLSFERYQYNTSINTISNISNFYNLVIEKIPVQESYKKHKIQVYIYVDENEKIVYFFSDTSTRILELVLHNYLTDVFYKSMTRCYVTSLEMRDSIKKILEESNYEARSKWWTVKERFGSEIKFEKKLIPALECFELLKYKSQSVNWIQLRVHTARSESFKIDLSRDGTISLHHPKFLEFAICLLRLFSDFSLKKTTFLDNKNMSAESLPKPIALIYSENVFDELDNRKNLLDKIRAYDRCTYSIIHGVNPHIYMLLTDTLDFSSFTLRTKGSDTILIIPHLFTSNTALNRFLHYLDENFQECTEMIEIEI